MCLHVYFCCTLPYHMVICTCILRHFKYANKILAYTTGTTSKHQRATWPELIIQVTWLFISNVNIIPMHCSVAYESVLSLAQCLRLLCRMLRRYQKRSKKCISTSNFETSSHQNVTAKKPIRNMYFTYVDMAWFHSLSRLEHDILHSTVWPVHKIYLMSMCWRPYPTCTKRMLFCLFFPEGYPYNRNLWFLLKITGLHSCHMVLIQGWPWFRGTTIEGFHYISMVPHNLCNINNSSVTLFSLQIVVRIPNGFSLNLGKHLAHFGINIDNFTIFKHLV